MISTVPQNHCRIIERFGKPSKVQHSGIRFKLPFIDKIKNVETDCGWTETHKQGTFIELAEQTTDTSRRECYTKDNAKLQVDCVIAWKITNPMAAVYEVDQLHKSLIEACLSTMRSEIGAMDLDDALSTRTTLNEKISARLNQTAKKWGINVFRVDVQELKTDDKTSDAMLQQMEAERKSRAIVSEAEGKAKAEKIIAEAEMNATVLRAQGEAQALQLIAEAEYNYLEYIKAQVGEEQASSILIANKFISGFETITKNPSDKVFLPNNFNSIFSIPTDKEQ